MSVCLSVHKRGTQWSLVSRPFPDFWSLSLSGDIPWSLVPGPYPCFCFPVVSGGTLVLSLVLPDGTQSCYWSCQRVPQDRGSPPPHHPGQGYLPRQDRSTPWLGEGTSSQLQTEEWVLTVRRAVCLWRSHRRTFLFLENLSKILF